MTRASLVRRRVGVLLHPTALPGTPVCGGLGDAARAWIRALADNGIGLWQVLPLSPPDGTGSPYSSPSSFAINPWLLDARDLSDQGFLQSGDLESLPGAESAGSEVDFPLANRRASVLAERLIACWDQQPRSRRAAFERWRRDQSSWLVDHATFMVLREQNQGRPWWEWPRDRSVHDQ